MNNPLLFTDPSGSCLNGCRMNMMSIIEMAAEAGSTILPVMIRELANMIPTTIIVALIILFLVPEMSEDFHGTQGRQMSILLMELNIIHIRTQSLVKLTHIIQMMRVEEWCRREIDIMFGTLDHFRVIGG